MQAKHDVQMAHMRVDMRQAQQDVRQAQALSSSGPHCTKLDLVDVKSMSPRVSRVLKTEHLKAWGTKFKEPCNANVNKYRGALEASEKCKMTVGTGRMQLWQI